MGRAMKIVRIEEKSYYIFIDLVYHFPLNVGSPLMRFSSISHFCGALKLHNDNTDSPATVYKEVNHHSQIPPTLRKRHGGVRAGLQETER